MGTLTHGSGIYKIGDRLNKNLTKPWREISYPSGQLISQVKR